jgi:predicted RNA binding protein YcfA (HicA-like mRNA interferase family)
VGGGHSWRLSEVIAVLKQFGISCEEPKSGSHWKCTKPGCRPYTIPAHNGLKTMIKFPYVMAVCRHFGLDKSIFRSNN